MKLYFLTTKDGEKIKQIKAEDEISATENFALIKNLSICDLLKIFLVK